MYSARLPALVAVIVATWFAGRPGHADVRGVFRLGVESLSLNPSDDMPLLGEHVDDAVTAYNIASAAYNRLHGYSAGSPMASTPIDRTDLGLHTTLVTFAPGIELGGKHVMIRLEGLFGVSDRIRAIGFGAYPIDVSLPLRNGTIAPYLVAGGTLRWLGRSDTDGETGGLVTVRVAAGARIARHAIVELGLGLFSFGGLYNRDELQSMMRYDPRGDRPLPSPDRAVSGGKQSGMVDVSIGFAL
jgi:hypothetical protein